MRNCIGIVADLLIEELRRKKDQASRKKRGNWTRSWILRRGDQGVSNNFLRETE